MKLVKWKRLMAKAAVSVFILGASCCIPGVAIEAEEAVQERQEEREPGIRFFSYANCPWCEIESYTDGGWWLTNTEYWYEDEEGNRFVDFGGNVPSEYYVALERMNENGNFEQIAGGKCSDIGIEWPNGLVTYVPEIDEHCYDQPGIYRYAMYYKKEDGEWSETKYSNILDLSNVTDKVTVPQIDISEDGLISWRNEKHAVYGAYLSAYAVDETEVELDYVSTWDIVYDREISDYWTVTEESWTFDVKKALEDICAKGDYSGYNFEFYLSACSTDLEKLLNNSISSTKISFTKDLNPIEANAGTNNKPDNNFGDRPTGNIVWSWKPTTEEEIFRFSRKGKNIIASADSHTVMLAGEMQGPLFFEAINNAFGEYAIESTYNLFIDSECGYNPEKVAISFELPEDAWQVGREVVLIGVKEDGTPVIVKDLDQDIAAYTFVPTYAYAYALCVR